MFTSVDSNRNIVEHFPSESVPNPPVLDNSSNKESKSFIASQFDKLLSKNDDYTKLQITIFVITFIVAILIASIPGIFLGFNFG